MRKTVCVHQVFKRKRERKDGVGNCEVCTADEDNKKCRDYLRMTLHTINVVNERRDDEESR